MCGGRSDDSSQDTSGSYNEAAQNFQAANPSYPSSSNFSARSASSIGAMANQSFAGGMDEGQGNVNFSTISGGISSDDSPSYSTPTFGNQSTNFSVGTFSGSNDPYESEMLSTGRSTIPGTNFRSGNLGGMDEGQDGSPIGNFGMGEGQRNVNFSTLSGGQNTRPSYNTPTFGLPAIIGPNKSVGTYTGSYDPSEQDEEQTSALSDDFLDEQGRADMDLLGKEISDYFDNPLVKAGQFAEGLFKSKNDMGGKSRPSSFFTTDAGLPNNRLGDMAIGVQQGGKLTTDSSGKAAYVTMPDGTIIGQQPNMSGGGGGGGGRQTQTPLDPCPAGFKLDPTTNSCQPVTDSASGTMGSKFVRNVDMPDFSNYGLVGGEHRFFTEMPGIINAKDGLPRHPTGEVKGAGGPKDDLVGPIMLSNKEYVMPHEMIMEEGDGNYDKGIMLLEKKRMSALRKYRDRNKSSGRNTA